MVGELWKKKTKTYLVYRNWAGNTLSNAPNNVKRINEILPPNKKANGTQMEMQRFNGTGDDGNDIALLVHSSVRSSVFGTLTVLYIYIFSIWIRFQSNAGCKTDEPLIEIKLKFQRYSEPILIRNSIFSFVLCVNVGVRNGTSNLLQKYIQWNWLTDSL